MEDLFKALDLGIAALALLHRGLIPVNCSNCDVDFQKDTNCLLHIELEDIPNYSDPVFLSNELDIEFYHCPISSIPNQVFLLYDRYERFKEGLPVKHTDSFLFWYFIKTYNGYSNQIEAYQHKKQIQNMKNKTKKQH